MVVLMNRSECNCFLRFLNLGWKSVRILCVVFPVSWRSLLWEIVRSPNSCRAVAGLHWLIFPVKMLQGLARFSGHGSLPTGFGGKVRGISVLSPYLDGQRACLHCRVSLPSVLLVLAVLWAVTQRRISDWWLRLFRKQTSRHPDRPLRPTGSPAALRGENYKNEPKQSYLVEVFGQCDICVRMD